ncbi:CFEM domain-containing protein [Xylariales sp. PMI_506]|nr:CFEM domain-containing protein [Xylariales sp. PMI_506]
MRTPLSFVLALLALVSWTLAQDTSAIEVAITELPTCAIECLEEVIVDSTCSLTNATCICSNAALQAEVTLCVSANCTIKESLTTKNVTETLCDAPVRDKSQLSNDIAITFGVLSAAFVLLRTSHKLMARMELGLDDWFIILTLLSGLPSTVMVVRGTTANGLGRDIWTIPFDNITSFGYWLYIMAVLYFLQVTLLKMSMLFFYLRIFPTPMVRKLLWCTIGFSVVFGLTFVFIGVFQCNPISYVWTEWDGEHTGTCLDFNAAIWANAGISIAVDLWMIVIPLSQLHKLNLHWKKKVGVGLMFVVGAFVTVVSIFRLRSLVTFANSQNPTWDDLDGSLWSTLEINVGIICACMPSLRLILVRFFPILGGGSNGTRKYAYGGSGNNLSNHLWDRGQSLGTASRGEGPARNPSVKAIHYQKSYTVQYGDSDEVSLVEFQKGRH